MSGRKQTGKTRGALKTGDQGNHVATSLSADKLITLAEAAVVLRLSLDITRQLATGPLAPVEEERTTLRRLLGMVVFIVLNRGGLMVPDQIIDIAAEVVRGVCDQDKRKLLVDWGSGKPALRWTSDEQDDSGLLHAPVLVIPANQMLADAAAAITALRQRSMH